MQESKYKSYDELPLCLSAKDVAGALGVSHSSAYALMHDPGFPTLMVSKRMVVPKEKFVEWVEAHTGGGGRR